MTFSDRAKDALWAMKHNVAVKVILLVVLVALAGGAVFLMLARGKGTPTANTNKQTNTPVAEVKVRRALDGVLVSQENANAFPIAVMVENLTASRPQSGLEKAGVVYEALAEGGITRFLALFAGANADKIGPVRSARPYFLDWAKEYDALYVHAGGSPTALADIASKKVNDLNQFFNNQYYWRDAERSKKGYATEHTLFTSTEKLSFALRDKKYPANGAYTQWTFTDDPALDTLPVTPQTITLNYSSFSYKAEWRYDRTTNSYQRFQAEQPHLMENGKQITAKNIVVQVMAASLLSGDEKGRLTIQTIGQGKAIIFHNGVRTDGTWKKDSAASRTALTDSAGQPITLTAGETWVESIPNEGTLTVS